MILIWRDLTSSFVLYQDGAIHPQILFPLTTHPFLNLPLAQQGLPTRHIHTHRSKLAVAMKLPKPVTPESVG